MIFGFSMLIVSITLGVGYFALIKASKQEGSLKTLGKIIAWFIIIVAIIGMLCATVNVLILKKGRWCGHSMGGRDRKMFDCPLTRKHMGKSELSKPKEETE